MNICRRADEWVPIGLIALASIPVVAGVLRLALLAASGPVAVQNARFFEAPIPLVVHIVSVTLFSVLGAFQFAPGMRRRWPGWHRAIGRVGVGALLGAATSGIWMANACAIVPADSSFLHGLRLFFGSSVIFATACGLLAILGGHVACHQAWLRRAYAIGLGAGTQALILGPDMLLFGEPGDALRTLIMDAAWLLNLTVAAWLIRRPPSLLPARGPVGK